MSEYILTYNPIIAPSVLKKFGYIVSNSDKRYSLMFHKSGAEHLTINGNSLEGVSVTPSRLLFHSQQIPVKLSGTSFVNFNSLDRKVEKISKKLHTSNNKNKEFDIFTYKINNSGASDFNSGFPASKTWSNNVLSYDKYALISDNGKYRNVHSFDKYNSIKKTIDSHAGTFDIYFGNKDFNRYTSGNYEQIFFSKSLLNRDITESQYIPFDKALSGKGINWENYIHDFFVDKSGKPIAYGPQELYWKKAFNTSEGDIYGSYKTLSEMFSNDEVLMSFKDDPKLYLQESILVKGASSNRNIIQEKYSWTYVIRHMPNIRMYDNEFVHKTLGEVIYSYDNDSFDKIKELFYDAANLMASKNYRPLMLAVGESFFSSPQKETRFVGDNELIFKLWTDTGIETSHAYAYKVYRNTILNNALYIPKRMPETVLYENIEALKKFNKGFYNYFFDMPVKNIGTGTSLYENITIHKTDAIGILNDSDFIFKPDNITNLLSYNDITFKEIQESLKNDNITAWHIPRNTYKFDDEYVIPYHGRLVSYIENVYFSKSMNKTYIEYYCRTSSKSPNITNKVSNDYFGSRDIYNLDKLYAIHGCNSTHDEVLCYRKAFNVTRNSIISMSINGIGKKFSSYYKNITITKDKKKSFISEQKSLYRWTVKGMFDDYFTGTIKDKKSSLMNGEYFTSRAIYELMYSKEDMNSYKSLKVTNLLADNLSLYRQNPSVMIPDRYFKDATKSAKSTIETHMSFLYRPFYAVGTQYGPGIIHKLFHSTYSMNEMSAIVGSSATIGREANSYDVTFANKKNVPVSSDETIIFSSKGIYNIYTGNATVDFAGKYNRSLFETVTVNASKVYTDTFVSSLADSSVIKLNTDTNAYNDYAFITPNNRTVSDISSSEFITKGFYETIDANKYSGVFSSKTPYDVNDGSGVYIFKMNVLSWTADNDSILKKQKYTNTSNENSFSFKKWYDVYSGKAAEYISKQRMKFSSIIVGDYIHKKSTGISSTDYSAYIDKIRKPITFFNDIDRIGNTQRNVFVYDKPDFSSKLSFNTSADSNFEEIYKDTKYSRYDKYFTGIKKSDALTSYFLNNDIFALKSIIDTMYQDYISGYKEHGNLYDMNPLESNAKITQKSISLDNNSMDLILKERLTASAYDMIRSGKGGIIAVSKEACLTDAKNNIIIADAMSKKALSCESIFTWKSDGIVLENDIQIFTDKALKTMTSFLGDMVLKDKINTFADNYSTGIFKIMHNATMDREHNIYWLNINKNISLISDTDMVHKYPFGITMNDDDNVLRERKGTWINSSDLINVYSKDTSYYNNMDWLTINKYIFDYKQEHIHKIEGKAEKLFYEELHKDSGKAERMISEFIHKYKRPTSLAHMEIVNFGLSRPVSVISLENDKDGHHELLCISVDRLSKNVTYLEAESIYKKYHELNIDKEDFGSWAWVYEPKNPFDDYKDLEGIDELLLPEKDFRYENFEDIIFNKKLNRPRNPVKKIDNNTWICKLPTKHPFKNFHENDGIAYVGEVKDNYYGINVKIMQEIFLKYYQIWQQNLFKFSTMSMNEASKAMLEYIYSWIVLYYPPENLEQAMRVFRQIRWYSESAVINNSQYIIKGEWTDLKMLDIENNLEDNDTMYYDDKLFVIRNTRESVGYEDEETGEIVGRTEASVEFYADIWKDTLLTFSVVIVSGSMNLYINDELVDTISRTQRFNTYPIKFSEDTVTIRFEKTAENNVDAQFFIADVRLKEQRLGDFSVEFDPKLKAGNKPISLVAEKMTKFINLYDDVTEAYTELQKKNIGIAVTVDMMKDYLELHHKNKTKGKRLTIKKT